MLAHPQYPFPGRQAEGPCSQLSPTLQRRAGWQMQPAGCWQLGTCSSGCHLLAPGKYQLPKLRHPHILAPCCPESRAPEGIIPILHLSARSLPLKKPGRVRRGQWGHPGQAAHCAQRTISPETGVPRIEKLCFPHYRRTAGVEVGVGMVGRGGEGSEREAGEKYQNNSEERPLGQLLSCL